ncbi:hypothetical protein HYFRA_00005941 [Hymenoscyphus fraxineus]|uniref:Uncharacterized protein n=1 Tax=Hymenoscyphus fraxineus TaxID=746836 RepID=A0A9N9KWW7_9HELO|nr:hypothetical protein HYFRA_00005941 [Hymenoscyphus fraxineus]
MSFQKEESWIQEFTTLNDLEMSDEVSVDLSELTTPEPDNEVHVTSYDEENAKTDDDIDTGALIWFSNNMGLAWSAMTEDDIGRHLNSIWYSDGPEEAERLQNFLEDGVDTTMTATNNLSDISVHPNFLNAGLAWSLFMDGNIDNIINERIDNNGAGEAQRLQSFLEGGVEEPASHDETEATPPDFGSDDPDWSQFLDGDIDHIINERIDNNGAGEAQRLQSFLEGGVEESASNDETEATPPDFNSNDPDWSQFVDDDINSFIDNRLATNGPGEAQRLETFFNQGDDETELEPEGEPAVEPEGEPAVEPEVEPEHSVELSSFQFNFESPYQLQDDTLCTGTPDCPLHPNTADDLENSSTTSGDSPQDYEQTRKRKTSPVDFSDDDEEPHTARKARARENIEQPIERPWLLIERKKHLMSLMEDLAALEQKYTAGYLSREEANQQHADRNWYDKRAQKYIKKTNSVILEIKIESEIYIVLQDIYGLGTDRPDWLAAFWEPDKEDSTGADETE